VNSTLDSVLDETGLRRLLQELAVGAREFRFEVAPNPCVGAAALVGERVLARGYHEEWGGPHAEVAALAALAGGADGPDTMVVTLEPCSTTGKTGPCTRALLDAGMRRVVVGALDPDPRHRGAGLGQLEGEGVEVQLVQGAAPLDATSPHFLRWTSPERVRRPRPWTIAKWAQTRSGQLSPPEGVGEGRWISAPESLAEVQLLRGRVDAILTGVGTVVADDPRLTVRAPGDLANPPMRVIVDSLLRTPPEARMLRERIHGDEEAAGPVHILCAAGVSRPRYRALEAAGAQVHDLQPSDAGVALSAVHTWLWQQGCRRVLLETGPTLLRAHLDAGLVDQLRVYTGEVNGGRGPSLGEYLAPHRLAERIDRECGGDAVLEAFPVAP
jgi:diaminohydroxyphosphoribosylaminopyrimidine deaminase/5-amino-6-(5-phosphoribosylamino)uracil reductase